MTHQSLTHLDISGKTLLIRVDLNVPTKDGPKGFDVTNHSRIDRLKPTIDCCVDKGAKIVLLSHFGRPEGQFQPEYSLAFLTDVLKDRWGYDVEFARDCVGPAAKEVIEGLEGGQIALLENVRFHREEQINEPTFAKELAALADIYINDAFSVSHRAHASTEGIAHYLPAAAGLLMQAELDALSSVLETPKKPVAAIIGGAKISTKLLLLNTLIEKMAFILLGGGMANTFLASQGYEMRKSLVEESMLAEAKTILEKAKEKGCRILLPMDVCTAEELKEGVEAQNHSIFSIPPSHMALDIGTASIENYKKVLMDCQTVLWNGPVGVFEVQPFDAGTKALAECVADITYAGGLTSVAGGGDTLAAVEYCGVLNKLSYVSTAGGAFLEWLEGKELPGIKALTQSQASQKSA